MYQLTVNRAWQSTHPSAESVLDAGSAMLAEYGRDIPVCPYDRPCDQVRRRKPCPACRAYEEVCREYEAWAHRDISINAGVTVVVAGLSLAVVPL